MKIAIIDLGSNSVRFDVYDVEDDHVIRRIHREKEMVRLGDGVFQRGRIKREGIVRTLRAFDRFAKFINKYDHKDQVRVKAFATSALRDAENAKALLAAVKKRTGIDIKVISGLEEGKLIAKGILNNESTPSGLFALVDIGGGSTEISICRKKSVIDTYSFDLGANRLQQVFLKTIPPKKNGVDPVEQLRTAIQNSLTPVIQKKKWPNVLSILGSSGTIRAYEKLLEKQKETKDPFKRKSLSKLIEKMIPLDSKRLQKLPGMDPKRTDLILAGGILLEEIMKALGAKHAFTTDYALRDGVLEQEMEKL